VLGPTPLDRIIGESSEIFNVFVRLRLILFFFMKLKFKITLDRHNARLKLNFCLLPDPTNFSVLQCLHTFKLYRYT
jgi:hypothetical protein